ncbi:hypothetical protein NFI96_026505, partial [Prochilodus magdalenae]
STRGPGLVAQYALEFRTVAAGYRLGNEPALLTAFRHGTALWTFAQRTHSLSDISTQCGLTLEELISPLAITSTPGSAQERSEIPAPRKASPRVPSLGPANPLDTEHPVSALRWTSRAPLRKTSSSPEEPMQVTSLRSIKVPWFLLSHRTFPSVEHWMRRQVRKCGNRPTQRIENSPLGSTSTTPTRRRGDTPSYNPVTECGRLLGTRDFRLTERE